MSRGSRPPAARLPTSVFGHRFRDETLLEAALSHPSSVDSSLAHLRRRYQQLEFLGDAVWNCCITEALISLLPEAPEGELSLFRARLVSAASLAELAKSLGLPPLLFLSKGEESTGGRERASILSGGFEAVIGAIYLDGGGTLIRRLARSVCDAQVTGARLGCDPKTALQQLTQSRFHQTPRYHLLHRSGPPHAPTFEVEVRVGQSAIGRGSGRSKQDAEQEAARLAMEAFDHPRTHNI
jgi:ribonuclease-3